MSLRRMGLAGALVAVSSWVAAGDGGTHGAAFLNMGAVARAAAMGEAYTALADDANAAFYNPAGLARVRRMEIAATHTQWIGGGRQGALSAALPTRAGTLAAHVMTLSFEGLEGRSTDTESPEKTFDSLDAAYGLSFGRSWGSRFHYGAGALYVRRTLDGHSAGAPAGSVGAQWIMPVGGLTLGAGVRNIGGSVKFDDQGDPLPMTAAIGLAGRWWNERLAATADLRQTRDEKIGAGAGVELSPRLSKDMSGRLRAGVRSDGIDADGASGLSLGMGLAFPRGSVDASWAPGGALGDTFRYSLRFTF